MKLPWDKKYMKISFHVIFTILIIYVLALIILNISVATNFVSKVFGTFITVLAPLLVALIFSFLINPIVDNFQKLWEKFLPITENSTTVSSRFSSRKRGTLTAYAVIIFGFFILIWFLINKIGAGDANALASKINGYIQDFTDLFVLLNVKLAEFGVLENVEDILSGWTTTLSLFVQTAITSFANSITRAGGWALNLILGLTIGFYLLIEKDKIIYYCKSVVEVFFGQRKASRIKNICHDINVTFSNYIGGQVTDAIIMAVLISASFSLVGIPYAVLIGIISGFSNLIPYVGAVTAFILSVGVGLLSGTPIKALYAVIIVLILQQVDSLFIVPKVVGKSVELHPALVLLSLAVFGGLFGIPGMIVAVPCGALLKTFLVRFYYEKKGTQE